MNSRRLHLVLAIIGCTISMVIGWEDIAKEIESLKIVEVMWDKALKPCECSRGMLDCSNRALSHIQSDHRCLGTPARVDLSYNQFTRFPDGLSSATVVNASKNSITTLPRIDQLNPQITFLDLSVNRIENVTESYRSLRSLEVLRLSWNKGIKNLSFLPRPCVLKILIAFSNEIQSIEEDIKECRQLEELNISNNRLSSLSPNAFSTLTNLRILQLSHNTINTLPPRVFVNLTNLEELHMDYNDINSLPIDIFNSLTLLKYLDFSGNQLQMLPQGILSGLVNLKILDLTANRFETLPIHAFENLQELQVLKISGNLIKTIPDSAFVSLLNVKEVHLLNNEITAIGNHLFANASLLTALTLGDNPIAEWPQGFFSQFPNLLLTFVPCLGENYDGNELRHIQHILIRTCGEMSWQPGAYASLASVVTLVVNYNTITTIANDTLQGLSNLRFLDINRNGITSLPASFFSYTPKLTLVSVMQNDLTTLPDNLFSGLVEVKHIFLTENSLVILPENLFQGLTTVERIDLSANQLSTIPPALFNGLPSLYELSLEGNQMTTLPTYESTWPPLRVVSFSKNQIREVSEAALRSWLGSGEVQRHLTLIEEEGDGPDPAALHWLAQETGVSIGGQFNCSCGCVRRGEALVHICVNMACAYAQDAPSRSWVDTLRDASQNQRDDTAGAR